MKLSIPEEAKENVLNDLKAANMAFQKIYPGELPDRQPVHTVYGGANLFKSDTTKKMGQAALKSFLTYAPDFAVLAKVLNLEGVNSIPKNQKDINALLKKYDKLSDIELKKQKCWLPYLVH